MTPLNTHDGFYQYTSQGWQKIHTGIIEETPVTLSVNGRAWLTFLCTPTQLEALAVGFLFNENIIQSAAEVDHVRTCAQNCNLDVWLRKPVDRPEQWRRTSGCAGGVTRADPTAVPVFQAVTRPILSPERLTTLMDQLFKTQKLYREVRGVHCSALSDGNEIILQAEDIGRHNTLDKIAGLLLLHNAAVDPRIVLTTGRISSEMLQKSARLGASMVVSRTSPSTLSIQLAHEYGITLVGYARRTQFNVYTHPERLTIP